MSVFVKSFSEKHSRDLDEKINDYAKSNKLEIVCVSIAERWDILNAIVVFKEILK
ncbi:hypothetical protein [Acinetobacter phage HFM1]|nr:hypothetical protein [Acinetobacter phage HFM1]